MPELLDWLIAHDNNFRSTRLPSLYSDFQRQKAVNPDGYKANIQTWQTGLRRAILANGSGDSSILSLSVGPKLLESLTSREYGAPSALEAVIDESISDKIFVSIDYFLSSQSSIYDKSWLPRPSDIATWALRQLGLTSLLRGHGSKASLAIVGNLEDAAAKLTPTLAQHKGRLDRLIPMQVFRKEAAKALGLSGGLSDIDISLLLVYLSRDKRLISYNKDLVKVAASGETKSDITAQEAEIVSLKDLQIRLSEQEALLIDKIQDTNVKAKSCIAEKNRSGAQRALRSKKNYESILERRSANLAQVEATLTKIEEAADQVEIVKAMQGSASVLRGLAAETGGRENVERIMDQLQDEMDKVDDVGALMQGSGPGAIVVDETEVDEELEALEAESKQQEELVRAKDTNRMLDSAPSVPQQRPTVSEQDLESSISALNRMSLDEASNKTEQAMRTEHSTKSREAINAT